MRVLVIDTAVAACTAAVFQDERALSVRSELMARGHSERLGGFVRDAVADAADGFEAIDRIGVTVGPGSFTGLRVGLAFAQGLGAALDRPVVGVSTLHALAWSVDGGRGDTAAIIDARRGDVYVQTFRDGIEMTPAQALTLEAARSLLGEGSRAWRTVGSGVSFLGLEPSSEIESPAPWALAALTARLDPERHPPRPLYLRTPDAVPPTRLPGQPRPPASSTGA